MANELYWNFMFSHKFYLATTIISFFSLDMHYTVLQYKKVATSIEVCTVTLSKGKNVAMFIIGTLLQHLIEDAVVSCHIMRQLFMFVLGIAQRRQTVLNVCVQISICDIKLILNILIHITRSLSVVRQEEILHPLMMEGGSGHPILFM
ncbi:hypothetical protein ACJX0J_018253 [Zea mays]